MQVHEIEIDIDALTPAQRRCEMPVLDNYRCPNMALMYRVVSFALDTRSQGLKDNPEAPWALQIKNSLIQEWGVHQGDKKVARFADLNISLMGLPDEYYELLTQIISAYCCGQYYPAMTAAGALGERILNRLILKTRRHFTGHRISKKIWNKESFDNWDIPIKALREWSVISDEVAEKFDKLKVFRNDAIHYKEGYDFTKKSKSAVMLLGQVVTLLLNYINRKDLFWVFDVPGEIWLRTDKENDPFVKEFVLSHCVRVTAYCEPFGNPPKKGKNVPLKPITDEEFLEKRRQFKGENA